MPALFTALFSFLASSIFGKALMIGLVFALMAVVVPMAISLVQPFLDTSGFASAMSGMPTGFFFFASLTRLDFGMQLVFSALIARFLIRRLPVIG
ncbi:MAG: hypothetical protein KJ798_02250 [Gammaproteobacteria bacterium]|nr:hypothetical protein [Gammaproteobacteria bacterium]MBU0849796.1 hypothetical protein [Gammaproteobacteria bacterium]MBU1267106.1 hypothetical protein [Gammaproteobacteria bacterium]MBU1527585.1 hypothetical protein [Gammaproteobacteria bacterium]MBU1779183.1 hypothetical protein [Gammaproteobacteria bacterium]